MKAADRRELSRLQREHKNLMQHNYRLPGLRGMDFRVSEFMIFYGELDARFTNVFGLY
jgi:hypothetical protein